jgi:hypothetical protein
MKSKRRTKAEIEQDRIAKAQAKAMCTEAKQQRINRTAAFEHADMANEDVVNATPHPLFAPKRPASTCNSTPTDLAMSGVEIVEDSKSDYSASDSAVAIEDSSVGSGDNESSPPAQKKTQLTVAKATKATVEPTRKLKGNTRVVQSDTETELDDDETPKKIKPKPKAKVRDEIDVATKKLKANKNEREAVRPTRQADVGLSGRPASKVPLQLQAGGEGGMRGKNLKREGAIADINQSTKRSHEPEITADNNRYTLFALYLHASISDVGPMYAFLLDAC